MATEPSSGRGIIGLRGATALALRLAWLTHTDTVPPVLSDPQYCHATAQNLA